MGLPVGAKISSSSSSKNMCACPIADLTTSREITPREHWLKGKYGHISMELEGRQPDSKSEEAFARD